MKIKESYTCVIWGLCKLTWQVNLTSYNLSSDLKRGKRARRKSICQVNLSSWLVCQVELVTASGICHLLKKFAGVSRQFFFRIAIASEKLFARFSGPIFACCRLSKKRVFGWTRCEIWLSHITPRPHLFLGTDSHEATQVVHRKLG